MPYEAYGDFHKIMKEAAEAMHDKHILSDFMPLTGLVDKLSASPGLQVLDVGCGAGYHACLLGQSLSFYFQVTSMCSIFFY